MATDDKQKAAERLIDQFAARLLALNGGKAIPGYWKNRLLKAIRPAPAKRGRKPDVARNIEIVRRLVLEGDSNNPANVKDGIAQDTGVSRKHVEDIDKLDWLDPELSDEKRAVVIGGMVAALTEMLRADTEAREKGKVELERYSLLRRGVPRALVDQRVAKYKAEE